MPPISTIYLGLDAHKDSVTIAVLPAGAPSPARVDELPDDPARLRRGAVACGHDTEQWTLERVAHPIRRELGVRYHGRCLIRALQRFGHVVAEPKAWARRGIRYLQRHPEIVANAFRHGGLHLTQQPG